MSQENKPTHAHLLMQAMIASHDADVMQDMENEVRRFGGSVKGYEPFDRLPEPLRAKALEIRSRYPLVLAKEVCDCLYDATLAMEQHARQTRDIAFEILPTVERGIAGVLDEVGGERIRQNAKFGTENIPSVSAELDHVSDDYRPYRLCIEYGLPSPAIARYYCNEAHKGGSVTWAHILVEEVCEAVGAKNDKERRGELVQVAAVAVAQIEDIDRKALAAKGAANV